MIKIFFCNEVCYVLFLFFGIMFSSISCSNSVINNDKKESIIRTIQEELTLHPKATLLDIYKNFFQGRFGPGHMISDLDAATNYLTRELQNATEFDSVLWQAVGYEERYYRVNLSLVHDGKIGVQDLITAFTKSANSLEHPSLESWKNEWNSILKIIEQMNITLPNFEKDKFRLSENLKSGIIVGHHSSIFQKNYHPHYRIVSRSYFDTLYKMVNEN